MNFIQARNYSRASGRKIDLVVIHDMESPEAAKTAESVAQWFAGSTAPRASAHYCIDNDSVVQCVREQDVAWHAPGANTNGIGIEHAGRANQTRAQWLDAFGLAMLNRSASLTAAICQRYKIPPVFVDVAGLRAGKRGITTHAAVSEAFHKSDHHDPGPNFPIDYYVSRVAAQLHADTNGNPPKAKAQARSLTPGMSGSDVQRVRTDLVRLGYKLPGTGTLYGPNMLKAVVAFQIKNRLTPSGIVGPHTRTAIAHALANGGKN